MNELSLKDKMKNEALERLDLLKASPLNKEQILNDWQLTKCVVDHNEKKIYDHEKLIEEEAALIKKFEEEYEAAVYYVIQDEGIWPDGCTFPRYTLLYIGPNEEEWKMEKEEGIVGCGTIPAYVINIEEPDCSELTEIEYKLVNGTIINIS